MDLRAWKNFIRQKERSIGGGYRAVEDRREFNTYLRSLRAGEDGEEVVEGLQIRQWDIFKTEGKFYLRIDPNDEQNMEAVELLIKDVNGLEKASKLEFVTGAPGVGSNVVGAGFFKDKRTQLGKDKIYRLDATSPNLMLGQQEIGKGNLVELVKDAGGFTGDTAIFRKSDESFPVIITQPILEKTQTTNEETSPESSDERYLIGTWDENTKHITVVKEFNTDEEMGSWLENERGKKDGQKYAFMEKDGNWTNENGDELVVESVSKPTKDQKTPAPEKSSKLEEATRKADSDKEGKTSGKEETVLERTQRRMNKQPKSSAAKKVTPKPSRKADKIKRPMGQKVQSPEQKVSETSLEKIRRRMKPKSGRSINIQKDGSTGIPVTSVLELKAAVQKMQQDKKAFIVVLMGEDGDERMQIQGVKKKDSRKKMVDYEFKRGQTTSGYVMKRRRVRFATLCKNIKDGAAFSVKTASGEVRHYVKRGGRCFRDLHDGLHIPYFESDVDYNKVCSLITKHNKLMPNDRIKEFVRRNKQGEDVHYDENCEKLRVKQ